MPQRRERMLAESTLPTMRYDVPGLNVPIRPRVDAVRPAEEAKPAEVKVAAEPEPEVVAEVDHGILSSGAAPVELIPVPASVFDDDFFKAALPARFSDAPKVEAPVKEAEVRPISTAYVQSEEVVEVTMRSAVMSNPIPTEVLETTEQPVRPGSFAARTGLERELAEPDELDIPAFLRRGNA
jgi:cell division protein FtsZ